jgi:hypothetical protein
MSSPKTTSSAASLGLCVAFFGPDGIGKSAVIEAMKLEVGTTFSSVVQFHFRPMFGRREDRPPVLDPHAQPPRSLLISSVKLIYWLLDCWYGYFIAIRPARRRSGLVIFDRYYPDILVDPVRYRLPASSLRFARWLTALAPRPDLCVLLDAPAEVVQHRKHEVSLPESRRQRLAYLAMFQSMPATLLVNADAPVNQVALRVGVAVSTLLQNSSMKLHEALLLADF